MRHIEPIDESFKAWTNAEPYLHNPWHYHPEFEINIFDKGKGILLIGDNIVDYDENTLILIGPNIPHEWRSSIKTSPDFTSKSYAVHFRTDFLGNDFYKLPECKSVVDLLHKSKRGVKINDKSLHKRIKNQLIKIINEHGFKRIYLLLELLDVLSSSTEVELLCSQVFSDSISEYTDQRMNTVYKHIMLNFKYKISIQSVASEVNMTTTSFCRFFKQRANISFFQYVNNIRIGYACSLLYMRTYSISEVAYKSGFENISNFNKQFLKTKGKTPSQFLAEFINS